MALSISDAIVQNTLGQSEGYPLGVPTSYDWYGGVYKPSGGSVPPTGFSAVTGWGQVYQEAGEPIYTNPNAWVEVANAKTYVHLTTGEWVLVQDQATSQLAGAHFASNFSGNYAIPMSSTSTGDASIAFAPPPNGYNDHFWPQARGTYDSGMVDAVYVTMDMRVSDANLNLVANVGADWWRSVSAGFVGDLSNNPGAGMSNWVELSTNWSTLSFYSCSTEQFKADPPPLFDGALETTPKITSFFPDDGQAGDGITSANVLTLAGTASAGSTVIVFDGTVQIGTVTANASGEWTFMTGQLSDGTHNFIAKTAGSSTASPVFNVQVDTPPLASGPNLLVNGSFEESSVGANRWAGFSSVPGWTALAGGTIELWNNLNGVQASDGEVFGELDFLGGTDGFSQAVQTVAGQSYMLSFDARSRPGTGSATCTVEVLWNDKLVATVPPGTSWETFSFTVTGTGGKDKLTFREAQGESADGLGALYDNISLVAAAPAATPTIASIGAGDTTASAGADPTIALLGQYAAGSFAEVGVGSGATGTGDQSQTLAQTLVPSSSFIRG